MNEIVNVQGQEWRDQQAGVNYPFADDVTLANSEGDFIPPSTFLDASLYPVGGAVSMYLSRVAVAGDRITLVVGDSAAPTRALVTFSSVSPPEILQLEDTFGRPAGILVSDATRLALFQAWTEGTHTFSLNETAFNARVCTPTPEVGFRGFVLEDGSIFSGDIWMIGDDGVVLRHETAEITDDGQAGTLQTVDVIRVDVVGDPLYRRKLCNNIFVTPQFLRTITFIHGCERAVCGGDTEGDVKITVGSRDAEDTVLRIRAVVGGLRIEAVGENLEGLG